jgi:primosomal protein N' (replication factor Y)
MSKQRHLFATDDPSVSPMPWETAADADRLAAAIVFDRPLNTVFHYLVPEALRGVIGPGRRVKVPFGRGNRLTVGYCVRVEPPPESSRRLKEVVEVIDRESLISPRLLELTDWMATRYLCGWGQVLNSVIPAGVKKKAGTRLVNHFIATEGVAGRLAEFDLPPKQRAVLETLCSASEPMTVGELSDTAGCGTGPINSLRDKGLIQAIRARTEVAEPNAGVIEKDADLELNADQKQGLGVILDTLRSGEHRTILLHGVTGSGKTEVYIQAIREVVSYGRQAIVLVPEISLTPQTIRRFRSRFDSVAVLHSHLSDAERHWHWQRIARGSVQVVVGARSAVFAPTPHLGLIVIDEEHETSFKQDTTPRYHAREVARRRAEMESVPLVLGSATPTLESWLRVEQKKDVLASMPRRVAGLPLPPVVVVDVRNDPRRARGDAIGRALEAAMRMALADDGQIILFLNLRGFSPTLWCRGCGEAVRCPHCDLSLTWHRDRQAALCHSCDYEIPQPKSCPACAMPGIRYLGIGTQRLEKEVQARFPAHVCLRMDSDSMRKPGSHDVALESFRKGEVQILLGTQMIAKGLDFPNVTLVGVIDADTVLHQPDLRASERTFQLISQVAGRTGRGSKGGRVLVQTSAPTEPAILKAAAHDYVGFVEIEMPHRRQMHAPPFRCLTRVILRGSVEETVKEYARAMAKLLRETCKADDLPARILGPAPAPLTRVKNKFRYHLQISAETIETIHACWTRTVEKLPRSSDVEFVIDVDAVNMR